MLNQSCLDNDLKQVLRMPPYGLSPYKVADVFTTDPIRVLRAVRFSAGFGLNLDPGVTKREIMKHAHRCKFDTPGLRVCGCACDC